MFLKHLLPMALRHSLRPQYQRTRKWIAERSRTASEIGQWKVSKQAIDNLTDSASLYRCAVQEFGVLQVENEITSFLDYVAESNPAVIGEIGLKHGGNSFLFLRKFESADLYLGMDLVLNNTSKLKYFRRPDQKLHFLQGNSQLPEVVAQARRCLAGRMFDFLFIDGDHAYEGAMNDFVNWYPLVKPGGLIALHDIVPDVEARTGSRLAGSKLWGGGVHRLWADLKSHFEYQQFVDDWDQGGFGIGVLVKPGHDELSPDLLQSLRDQAAVG